MDRECTEYKNYISVLNEELLPAMGCTEPVAIAYAAAKCRETLGCRPEVCSLYVSGNIIKNVKSVVVPNTGGLKGLRAAVAAGIVAGRSELMMDVIADAGSGRILFFDKAHHFFVHIHTPPKAMSCLGSF